MKIHRIEAGMFATNAYIIWDKAGHAAIVDSPPDSASQLAAFIKENKLQVQTILNTHGHCDHVADNAELSRRYNAPILIHREDEWRIREPYKEKFPIPFHVEPTKATNYLAEGDEITIGDGNIILTVIETPGHSKGSVCLFEKRQRILFGGDLLFKGAVGRWDFSDGNINDLKQSLQTIVMLGEDVTIYPGHGDKTTVQHELEHNQFLISWIKR